MIDLLRSNHIMILSKTVARLVRQVMEWSGRTPAPPASDAGSECQAEHRHVQQISRDHCHDGALILARIGSTPQTAATYPR
jgi:hypothetical protein